jgi:DNA-binding XRE family transcriptional regulator
MKPQFITTEAGDRLVVLTEREYDALLARAGDEAAEDRTTVRIAEEAKGALASGEAVTIPGWFVEAAARGGPMPLRGVRKHRGLSQDEVAAAAGITQGYYSDVERGAKAPADEVLARIAGALQVEPAWLRCLERSWAVGA